MKVNKKVGKVLLGADLTRESSNIPNGWASSLSQKNPVLLWTKV